MPQGIYARQLTHRCAGTRRLRSLIRSFQKPARPNAPLGSEDAYPAVKFWPPSSQVTRHLGEVGAYAEAAKVAVPRVRADAGALDLLLLVFCLLFGGENVCGSRNSATIARFSHLFQQGDHVMRMLKTLAAISCGLVLGHSGALADASRFSGTYKPAGPEFSSWDCVSIGQDGGALLVTPDTFVGVETQCKLRRPVAVNGMNATLFDAECAGEGYEWVERIMFMLSDEGRLFYVRDGFAGEWVRC